MLLCLEREECNKNRCCQCMYSIEIKYALHGFSLRNAFYLMGYPDAAIREHNAAQPLNNSAKKLSFSPATLRCICIGNRTVELRRPSASSCGVNQ